MLNNMPEQSVETQDQWPELGGSWHECTVANLFHKWRDAEVPENYTLGKAARGEEIFTDEL